MIVRRPTRKVIVGDEAHGFVGIGGDAAEGIDQREIFHSSPIMLFPDVRAPSEARHDLPERLPPRGDRR